MRGRKKRRMPSPPRRKPSSASSRPELGLVGVLDQVPGFLIATDLELRVTAAHGSAFEEVGSNRERMIGRTLPELMADDPARELVLAAYRHALDGRGDRFEYRVPATGRTYETRVEALHDEHGRVIGASGLAIDVSARRRADEILAAVRAAAEALLRSDSPEDELAAVLGQIGVATQSSRVYVFENRVAADGEPIWSQQLEWVADGIEPLLDERILQELRYRESYGRWADALSRGEVIAGAISSFPAQERPLLEQHGIRSMLVAPITVGEEWIGYVGLDDCEREREWSAPEVDALRAAGRILGAAIHRTRSEQARRQTQRLEAIGRVAGGIAHDFNNLLTVILGCSEEALQGLEAESPARRELEAIGDAARQAATLTGQLLAFSRRQELKPTTVDLNEALYDLTGTLRRLLADDLELALDPADDLPPVRVDPGQLSQVILNLAVNARDAMPDGGRLSIATAPAADGFVALTIRDDGAGMEAGVAARAFEPFFTTKEPGQGAGLGLATVHGIVTQSGGRIELETRPGAGTTVTVLLPRAA
jgi:two-component system cell cycle sensor histidine kinase/response regulator CckA